MLEETSRRYVVGVSLLCGIGFTMSLFIANLAFAGTDLLDIVKVGVLIASLAAGALGSFVLLGARTPASPED